jgi:hypothetical protein
MSVRALEAIIGKAVVSERFRAGILNGQRGELIRQFSLEPDETSAVMSIQAQNLTEFACAIEKLTMQQNLYGAFPYDCVIDR